jgi:hypothetical protein
LTGPLAALGLALFVNGAFDLSPPRRLELVAMRTYADEDHHDVTHVVAHGTAPFFGEIDYAFDDPKHVLTLPATVTVTWGSGALGVRWEAAPAVCHTPDSAGSR